QGFDIGREEVVEDLGCTSGFLRAVQLCTRVRSGGLAWLGVPCSSFTFLASSYHQRTMDNPMGRVDRPGVRLGNLLLARSMLLILVCIARSVYFFIEQPRSSTLKWWPHLQALLRNPLMRMQLTDWNMGTYGGWSLKPQMGISNAPLGI
ncbi:unnamed protein product, partial [Effrenium voratum]